MISNLILDQHILGSGAGGSVVIYAKELVGNPKDEILVSIGEPVVYALGAGGGGYI